MIVTSSCLSAPLKANQKNFNHHQHNGRRIHVSFQTSDLKIDKSLTGSPHSNSDAPDAGVNDVAVTSDYESPPETGENSPETVSMADPEESGLSSADNLSLSSLEDSGMKSGDDMDKTMVEEEEDADEQVMLEDEDTINMIAPNGSPKTWNASPHANVNDILGSAFGLTKSDLRRYYMMYGEKRLDGEKTLNEQEVVPGSMLQVDEDLELFVRDYQGNTSVITSSPRSTVAELKRQSQARTGVQVSEQRLIWKSITLQDNKKLSDYKIESGDTLQLNMRLHGGA